MRLAAVCLSPLASLALLAACAGTPPPPTGATTALAPPAAADRLVQALAAEAVDVERRDDGLRLTTSSERFVRCLPVTVGGGDSRRVFVQVRERRGSLDIRLAGGEGGTTATWQGQWRGRYDNPVNNTSFEQACESTGALETLLLRALAA